MNSTWTLSQKAGRALDKIYKDNLSDPIKLITKIGYDKRFFFQNSKFQYLDFRFSNLVDVSFQGASLNDVVFNKNQIAHVYATSPNVMSNIIIVPQPRFALEFNGNEHMDSFAPSREQVIDTHSPDYPDAQKREVRTRRSKLEKRNINLLAHALRNRHGTAQEAFDAAVMRNTTIDTSLLEGLESEGVRLSTRLIRTLFLYVENIDDAKAIVEYSIQKGVIERNQEVIIVDLIQAMPGAH